MIKSVGLTIIDNDSDRESSEEVQVETTVSINFPEDPLEELVCRSRKNEKRSLQIYSSNK